MIARKRIGDGPKPPKPEGPVNTGWSASNAHSRGSIPSVAVGSSGLGSSSPSSALNYVNAMSDYIDNFNVAQTKMVNEYNAREAEKNREWQERMARNAHQYEVEDLIKAGLNPVLSAGGQGAFVGNGAVASGQKAVADDTRGMAALSLLNSSINSAGRIASQVASRGTPREAEEAWKLTVTDGIKIAGIASSLFRTASNGFASWMNYNRAMTYGMASALSKQFEKKRYYR